ncbi:AAA family ATPase [Luedemannella flava]
MSTRLGDLLDNARRERFVGRRREVASFDDALDKRSPQRLLFVHGEGGIGKTTLLLELRARALAAGRPVIHVDGRDIDPSPQGMATALGLRPGDDTVASLPAGAVLLVDGYEQMAPVDVWLRDVFVPGLSADNVVVLAGRDPPAAPWRTDPGWRHLVAVHRLDPLVPAESFELLAHAGVDPSVRPHLCDSGAAIP